LDGGSARLKAYTYPQYNRSTEERDTNIHASSGIRTHILSICVSGRSTTVRYNIGFSKFRYIRSASAVIYICVWTWAFWCSKHHPQRRKNTLAVCKINEEIPDELKAPRCTAVREAAPGAFCCEHTQPSGSHFQSE
jgi:hypothetical protein